MDTISQLQQDIERYDADAVYYIGRAEHCRREAALLRQELEEEQARKQLYPMRKFQRLRTGEPRHNC
jgi:cell division protein FtsB